MSPKSRLNLEVHATPLQPLASQHDTPEERSFIQRQERLEAEDENISKAIEMSLNDELDRRLQAISTMDNSNQESPDSPSIQETFIHNIDDLLLRLSNDFTPLNDPGGDTLIYIGSPPRLPGQSNTEYQHVRTHFERVHTIHSSKLKGMNSTRFDKFLGPMSVRTEKRLRKIGVLVPAEARARQDFKYFIDLRPPSEDVDAVILVTDLTCTPGVLYWHFARKKYAIPRSLIAGTDGFDVDEIAVSKDDRREQNPTTAEQRQDSRRNTRDKLLKASSQTEEPHVLPGPEYCPVRHRSGIERILQAIQGNDPKLDSAPKMWTFFALARYFDCAKHGRVNKWISSWIYADANSNFIQCNPEVVHQIGMGIESFDMVRDAFSILVGETALLHVYGEADPSVLSPLVRSVHGRRLETILDEDERNRVDHAASSLVRRMRAYFVPVFRDLSWLDGSYEYRKLRDLIPSTPEELAILKEAKRVIHDFVRGKMYWVMCQLIGRPFIDHEPRIFETEVFRPGTRMCFEDTYNKFNQPMRLFTRTLWIALSKADFTWGRSNISHEGTPGLIGKTHLAQAMLDGYADDPFNGINETTCFAVSDRIVKVNEIIVARHEHELIKGKQREEAIETTLRQNIACDRDCRYHTLGVSPNTLPANHPSQASSGSLEGVFIDQLNLQSPKRNSEEFGPLATTSDKRQKTDVDEHDSIALPFRARDAKWAAAAQQGSRNQETALEYGESDQGHNESTTTDVVSAYSRPKLQFDGRTGYAVSQSLSNPRTSPDLQPRAATTTMVPPQNTFAKSDEDPSEISPSMKSVRFVLRPKIGPDADAFHASPLSTMENANTSLQHETTDLYNDDDALYFGTSTDLVGSESSHIQTTTDTPEVMHRDQPTMAQQLHQEGTSQEEDWWLANPSDTSSIPSTAPKRKFETSTLPNQHPLQFPRTINVDKLLREFSPALYKICDQIINPPHLFHGVDRVPTDLIDTLTCLDDNEWKYLPLWAGGLDDGTGGVFDEADVPNLEAGGFRGGKRGMGRVKIVDGVAPSDIDSESTSSFDDIASEAVSTVGRASKQATDGTDTVKSLSDTQSEADGFMRQDEIYEQIQTMKMDHLSGARDNGKGKAKMPEYGAGPDVPAFDDNEDMDLPQHEDENDGNSTIMGGRSDDDNLDIQGDMFHDIDDDDNDDNENDNSNSNSFFENETKEDSDSDIDIIDKKDFL